MLRLVLLLGFVLGCLTLQQTLDRLNEQIAFVEAKVLYLASQRLRNVADEENVQWPILDLSSQLPTIDSQRRQYFNQQLTHLLGTDSGLRTFLLVVRQELFLVECFPFYALIFDLEGTKIAHISHELAHYSLIKSPVEPLVGFLTVDNKVLLCNSDTNLSRCSEITLKSHLVRSEIVGLYIYRHENRHIISIFTKNGRIHIYNEDGEERSLVKTRHRTILKVIDHSPYPIIVGGEGLSVFEPVRTLELEMSCPMLEEEVVDAASESAFSGNLYVMLKSGEVLIHTYSLKKHDKECKVTGRLQLNYHPQKLQVFYPLVLMNNTFVNISDTVVSKQLLLPLQLCPNNTFQSVYRKSEYYLLHQCCQHNELKEGCKSVLYRRDKPQSDSSKIIKFGVFIVLLLVVSFRIFGKSTKESSTASKVEEDELNKGNEQARIQRLVDLFAKENPKSISKKHANKSKKQ